MTEIQPEASTSKITLSSTSTTIPFSNKKQNNNNKNNSNSNSITPKSPELSRDFIRNGDNVLIRLPSTLIKAIKITENGTISLGKFGNFKAKELIGKPYGDTYEIKDGLLQVVLRTMNDIQETEANNENISSTGAQKLTAEEIKALKTEGMSGRDIIQKQVDEHAAFELKTEYSKEKYLKKKEAKYIQTFTPIEPTAYNICEFNFERESAKIRDIRPDTLGQIMALANVRPGGRLLVVEDVHGLIVAAAVERMGGEGRILVINDADSPPDLHIMDSFNFSTSSTDLIESIHWAATEESYIPPDLPLEVDPIILNKAQSHTNAVASGSVVGNPATGGIRNSKLIREQTKLKKRKFTFDKFQAARDEFFAGGFDGVIIATEYEPHSVLERLLPSIGGSASIVVHSPYLSVLQSLHTSLRSSPSYLSPTISEPFLRKYQVLPGRLHPEMQGLGHGGFLLNCWKIIFNLEEEQEMIRRRGIKRDELKEQKERTKRSRLLEGAGVKQEEGEESVL